jgi:polar amino acid transport system substrate-binding protein
MKNRTIWRLAIAFCVLLLASGVVLLAGCGGNETRPTEPPATDAVPEPPLPSGTPSPGADGIPAEALATSGEAVYAAECAECHGQQGEGIVGPALLGDGANLTVFNTAQGLHNFVHLSMPQDAPGSLTDQQYLEVVTYLLVENAVVEPDTSISLEGLGNLPLE